VLESELLPSIMDHPIIWDLWKMAGNSVFQVVKEASYIYYNVAVRGSNTDVVTL
jgi:hypothetical protein